MVMGTSGHAVRHSGRVHEKSQTWWRRFWRSSSRRIASCVSLLSSSSPLTFLIALRFLSLDPAFARGFLAPCGTRRGVRRPQPQATAVACLPRDNMFRRARETGAPHRPFSFWFVPPHPCWAARPLCLSLDRLPHPCFPVRTPRWTADASGWVLRPRLLRHQRRQIPSSTSAPTREGGKARRHTRRHGWSARYVFCRYTWGDAASRTWTQRGGTGGGRGTEGSRAAIRTAALLLSLSPSSALCSSPLTIASSSSEARDAASLGCTPRDKEREEGARARGRESAREVTNRITKRCQPAEPHSKDPWQGLPKSSHGCSRT